MRNQPFFVDRIPVKTEADLVEYPAEAHGKERFFDHLKGVRAGIPVVPTHQEIEIMRVGELGGASESAPDRVKRPGQLPPGPLHQLRAGKLVHVLRPLRLNCASYFFAYPVELLPPVSPEFRDFAGYFH